MEVGFKVPLISIFTFDAKTGEETAHRELSRYETAKVTRNGQTISKSYIVKKLARNSLLISPPNPSVIVVSLARQIGYLIERKEVGDTIGPFWSFPSFEGGLDDMAAYQSALNSLTKLQEETAYDIRRRAALSR